MAIKTENLSGYNARPSPPTTTNHTGTQMHKPIVIIGIGEMAGVFSHGFLRSGYPVYPVTRAMNLNEVANALPEPELVLVAVGEADIEPTLANIPSPWRQRLALLQNELLPRDWQCAALPQPSVISVWFEKKSGQATKVLIPSPVFGQHAPLLQAALAEVDIPCYTIESDEALRYELVRKNVYILTTNIAGLVVGGNVAELWQQHEELARAVASDVMDIQQHLLGQPLPRAELIAGMLEAFEGDPEHRCMGRSAPTRLARALTIAEGAGLTVAKLREIAAR